MKLREPGESTETRPNYCSVCFNEDPTATIRYIDCDAACDRGWYGKGCDIAMDDLVICEECGKNIGELLGMDDAERLKELNLKLASQNEELKKEVAKAEEYGDRMADVLSHKGLKIDHRIKPRPARTGASA